MHAYNHNYNFLYLNPTLRQNYSKQDNWIAPFGCLTWNSSHIVRSLQCLHVTMWGTTSNCLYLQHLLLHMQSQKMHCFHIVPLLQVNDRRSTFSENNHQDHSLLACIYTHINSVELWRRSRYGMQFIFTIDHSLLLVNSCE